MSDPYATFRCGCPWRHRRVDLYQYQEVHSEACRQRSRAHAREYAEALHRRYDHVNTVVFAAVPVILEGLPADDEPNVSGLESERPTAIPPMDISLAMARVFQSGDYPSTEDWARVCSWWLRREAGLLDGDDG